MVQIRDNEIAEIPVPELRWNSEIIDTFVRSYDSERDILFAHTMPKRPAMAMDVGGHLWIRFDPETHEVIGIEIEDFERVFLVKYPELSLGWTEDKPKITKPLRNDVGSVSEYLRFLIMYVKGMLEHHPLQTSLPPA